MTRWSLSAVIAVAALSFFVVLDRSPTVEVDTQLYASIARALQLHGDGLPTSLRLSPLAVDHLPFYGPVYFHAAAASFQSFGVSKWSIRLVSVAGALLIPAAGALLARHLSRRPEAALWAAALLLLAPDLRASATNGSMQTLAIGLELAGLAVWVRGTVTGQRPFAHAVAAGVLLGGAVLTTPRAFPFVASFLMSGTVVALGTGRRQPTARFVLLATGVVLAAIIALWGWWAHGSPTDWARYMGFIFTHEDTDIAFVPGVRLWFPRVSTLVTPGLAAIGAIGVAIAMRGRPAAAIDPARAFALKGALLTGGRPSS